MNKNYNILITGGLGHIGSKLTNELKRNHNVTVLDNMLTQRYCSLFNNCDGITFLEESFENLTVDDINNYDIIVHLGARTNAETSVKDSGETFNINVDKTKKFIDNIKRSDIKLFVFPSSTSVYGKSTDVVYEDDDSYINPQSPYAESKISIERYIKESEIPHCILRLGTIFGYSIGMRFHTAINKFCYQASFDKPLTIWRENYDQFRPYLGINDVVKAIELIIDNESGWNGTYNVLTGNYSLNHIVEFIRSIKDVALNFVDTPLLNQHSYNVNFDKIKKLGYVPEDNIENEIKNTIRILNG